VDKEEVEFEARLARRLRARGAQEDEAWRLGNPWMGGMRRDEDDEPND
jgi:hypothetical protein